MGKMWGSLTFETPSLSWIFSLGCAHCAGIYEDFLSESGHMLSVYFKSPHDVELYLLIVST
jgi:hypothetical protein